MVPRNLWLAAILALGSLVVGHPGESEEVKRQEALARADYLASLKHTNLAQCAGKLGSKAAIKRTIERRQQLVQQLVKRSAANLQKRQSQGFIFDKVLAKSHRSKLDLSSNFKTADWSLLGQNKSVVLHPDTTEGPFWVDGEFIRKNVVEKEPGVPLHMDIQVVDINTCTPIPKAAIEIWSANAAGVYSGVVGFGNTADESNKQNKALRGIQIADKDGAVQFETILPGGYVGRTAHIHVMTHLDHKVLPNNTITGGRIAHIGQIFFDQDLVDDVRATVPAYKANPTPPTKNNRDFIMAFDTAGGFDPVLEYALLGKKYEDGLFGWINFGVNATKSLPARAAAKCGADGCKAQSFSLADLIGKGGAFGGKGKGGAFGGKGKGGAPFGGKGKSPFPGMPGMPGKGGEMPKGLIMPSMADMLAGLLGGLGGLAPAPKAPGS